MAKMTNAKLTAMDEKPAFIKSSDWTESTSPRGYKKCPSCESLVRGPKTLVCPCCKSTFKSKAKPKTNGQAHQKPNSTPTGLESLLSAKQFIEQHGSLQKAITAVESVRAVTDWTETVGGIGNALELLGTLKEMGAK